MTTPALTAEAEALLLEGIRAAFATAEGNVQTPDRRDRARGRHVPWPPTPEPER